MGFHSNSGEESYDKKTSKVNTVASPQPKQRKKLGSILHFEEYEDDSHPQAVKAAEKSKVFHQKQHVETKLYKSEEVVRYMSCLPSYLERGEKSQEKPFNIGVLDWRQLEKWQHNNADVFGMNTKSSPSTSTSTSCITSKVSSFRPSDNNLSHHHRNLSRPSTSTGGRSSGSKLLAGSERELPECRSDPINVLRVHQNLLQATQSSNLDSPNRQKDSKSLDPSLQEVTGRRLPPSETDGIISGLKGNDTIWKREALNAKEPVPSSAVTDLDSSERCKTRQFATCHQSDSSEGGRNGLLEGNQFYEGTDVKVSPNKLRSENNRFCSVVSEHGKIRDSGVEKSLEEARSLNCPTDKEQRNLFAQTVSVSPARRMNLEKNSDSKPRNLARDEILPKKVDGSESAKVRNSSPTRRFSFGITRIVKSSNSNSSDRPKQVLEILPDSKATSTSACSDYSTGGKSNATGRARTSPLRRLLDPLLKPKGVDSREFAQSSKINPSARDRSLKPSNGQREYPASLSVKETADLKGFRADDIGRPHHTQKNGTSTKQAFLQIAVKNGLPLFTFTVDNCRDILAATVKELSSKESTGERIYTFFSFRETKKKHAQWINQGCKDKNLGFVSNIVAMMKVSDIVDTDSTGQKYDKSSRREFVLSAVGSREADQTADPLPCDELAAVVVKYPERVSGQLNQDRSYSGDDDGNESGSDRPFKTTVILPGGHHGVPSKGEPSSLIKRWKSGGSCDCGGWDLGCQLTILAGSNLSIKSQSTCLKLFSQEEDERPVFVLSPYEEGIFSVEFDSSLKLIQAFSIAIAVMNSRRSVSLSSAATSENSASKIFNRSPVEVTAKYASVPPLSPVGRV